MNLADILTGRSLDIPVERLDLQGLAAAIRAYNDASPEEQSQLEIGLAETIRSSDNWSLIVDAIYLTRSLRMSHQMIKDAIGNVSARVVPEQYSVSISTEIRRYSRDVYTESLTSEAVVEKPQESSEGHPETEDSRRGSSLELEPRMTVAELSQYLKLDRMTIYKMLRENRLPASRIGHQWRFFREDIDKWIRRESTDFG